MRVLLTSAGLETEEIQEYVVKMTGKKDVKSKGVIYSDNSNRSVAKMHE